MFSWLTWIKERVLNELSDKELIDLVEHCKKIVASRQKPKPTLWKMVLNFLYIKRI
jgi:hypothetical protein